MSDESERPESSSEVLAFVCWRGGDGARVTSGPLPRELADALARAYASFLPPQSYWVEEVPWLEPAPRVGASRRSH